MIEIIFRYNEQDYDMEYDGLKKLKDLFEEFAKKQSLVEEEIFLLYNNTRVNLETSLPIEEQFDLLNLKTKKRLIFFVFRETPYQIIFQFPQKTTIIEVKLNEPMKDVIVRYASKARIKLDGIYFIYSANRFDYESIENKTVGDMISNIDKNDKLMSVSVNNERAQTIDIIKVEEEPPESINNIDEKDKDDNSKEEKLIKGKEEFEENDLELTDISQKKEFYLNNFFILLMQYAFIILLTEVGFDYKFNEILIDFNTSLLAKYLLGIVFFFLLAYIVACLPKYKTKRYMIIFHVFYPIFIIYFGYLFSSFIDQKYIIIGLSLIVIQIFSLLFNITFKILKIKYICLFSSISSLIGLVFFSYTNIKSFYPILYISIFWLISNIYYILWIVLTDKVCKFDEYFYSSLIFDYGIFLGLSKGILYVIELMFKNTNERNNEANENNEELQEKKIFYLYNFIILFIYFSLVIIVTIVGFDYKLNKILIEYNASLEIKYIPFLAFIFLSSIIIACLYNNKNSKWLIIFHVFYHPFIIYYSFLLSSFIDTKYIIIGLCLIEIQIFSLLFNILLKKFELKYFIFFSFFFCFMGLGICSFFWIKSILPILLMAIFTLVSNIIYICTIYIIDKYCNSDEIIYSTLIFNYSIFLAIVFFLYGIFKCIHSIYKKRITDEKNKDLFRIFGLLLIQYIIIILFVWVGFSIGLNDNITKNISTIIWIFLAILICIILISIHLLRNIKEMEDGGCWIFYLILYIPIMILLCYSVSYFVEEKYILSFIFIIFFELLSIFLCVFFGKSFFGFIPISCVIANLVTIFPFHFFWLNNETAHIVFWILGGLGDIYFSVIAYFFQREDILYFPVVCFDYGFFSLIIFLIKSFYVSLGKCTNNEC